MTTNKPRKFELAASAVQGGNVPVGVLGTKVIFIGPDCGGKSTLAALYAREVGVPLTSHRKMKDDLTTLASVSSDVLIAQKHPHLPVVRDQWPFPVDIIYQRTALKSSSILSGVAGYLGVGYRKAGFIFVYVTATPEEISKRLAVRGDELWNEEQILAVEKDYERAFVNDEFKIHMIRVDTTGKDPLDQVHEVIERVNNLQKQIGGIENE